MTIQPVSPVVAAIHVALETLIEQALVANTVERSFSAIIELSRNAVSRNPMATVAGNPPEWLG